MEATSRLFREFRGDKFTKTPLGKNNIAAIPSEIATYLKPAEASSYTGHALRVSYTTTLADQDADILELKRHIR